MCIFIFHGTPVALIIEDKVRQGNCRSIEELGHPGTSTTLPRFCRHTRNRSKIGTIRRTDFKQDFYISKAFKPDFATL
jgi:hypothetical protein